MDSTTLAHDFSQRVRANPCLILDPVTEKLLPVNQWPKVLQRMVRKFHFDKEGNVKNVEFAATSHLDGILAAYTGMIGDRPPIEAAAPMTTIVIVNPIPGEEPPLALPSMEEILGWEVFDGDDLGPLLMDIELPDEGEEQPWTLPPEPVSVTVTDDDDQTGGPPPARIDMNW